MIRMNILLAILLIACTTSCKKDKKLSPEEEFLIALENMSEQNKVKQFIFDGMSLYYRWNKDFPASSNPIEQPYKYFMRGLNENDRKHEWSFITNDVQKLMDFFSGEQKDFGYSVDILQKSNDELVAAVQYVFPGSPAAQAGLKRGDIIHKIGSEKLNKENKYKLLFQDQPLRISYTRKNGAMRETELTPVKMPHNPVLCDTVFEVEGKKIAYLFYTGYINNFNSELLKAFKKFKAGNATELILDIRYNSGGSIASAAYLVSLMVPAKLADKKTVLARLDYNTEINQLFDIRKWERETRLTDTLMAGNLNLDKIHVIATRDSYSASELTIHGLKAHMNENIVHIGEKTGGKYTASWTIHPYDDNIGIPVYDKRKFERVLSCIKNWAMQPIVAIYTDANNKDFSKDDGLLPNIPVNSREDDPNSWVPIGDKTDYLVAEAIAAITGKKSKATAIPASSSEFKRTGLNSASVNALNRSVWIK